MSFLRWPIRILFAIYAFLYPGSVLLVALDQVPAWGVWMGGALLILQGSLMGIWLWANLGRPGLIVTGFILFFSWLLEHIGATSGFPFGTYSYTTVLQPQIIGVVPLAIPFAWVLIIGGAFGVSEGVLRRNQRTIIVEKRGAVGLVLLTGTLAVLIDIVIEPFAVHINQYWVWGQNALSGYYGIPLSNFIAWWLSSLAFAIALFSFWRLAIQQKSDQPQPMQRLRFWPWLPATLYLANLLMFAVVNISRGQPLAGAIGVLLLLVLGAALGFAHRKAQR